MTNDVSKSRYGSGAFAFIAIIPILTTILFGGVDTGTWAVLTPMFATVIVCWALHSIKSQELTLSTNLLQIPLIALILIGLVQLFPISNIRSLDPYNTRLFLIRLICYLAFFSAALVFINTERRLKFIAYGTVVFGAVMGFAATLQRLASPEAIYGFREPYQAIPFGPFVNQHHFAGFMEMTGALVTALLLSPSIKRDKKLLLGLAALVMALACVLTSSRGGLACFVTGVILVALMMKAGSGSADSWSDLSYKKLGIGLSVFAVCIVALVIFVGGDQSLLRGIGLQSASGDISSGRLHFWEVSLKLFAANPVLGVGLDAFGVAFTQHDTWNGTFRIEQAHNEYLQLLAEGGVLALGCSIAFVALLFRTAMRNIRSTNDPTLKACAIGSFGGCIAICLHSLVDFPLRTPSNAFFFLLLTVVATSTSHIVKRTS